MKPLKWYCKEPQRLVKIDTHLSIATSSLLYNSLRCLRSTSGFGLFLVKRS